ncbi:putative glucose-6-phosphate 1-epimerase [Gossypium arboreum]|uniref:putative glucose-6-phosphate 1-epimerase n=1 Tax=Gossypium arboreum TaxID=29729 RepID=UPI000819201A|nr:putative glucose-6-phosphate 1-epimerase [Gossypium arboreum]
MATETLDDKKPEEEEVIDKENEENGSSAFKHSLALIPYVKGELDCQKQEYKYEFKVFLFSEVRVEGLETLDYLDNLQNRERFIEQGDAITVESEVDKIYLSRPTKIAILDHERKRTFELRKDGLPDAGEFIVFISFHPNLEHHG